MVGVSLLVRVAGIHHFTVGVRKVLAMVLLRIWAAGRGRGGMSKWLLLRFFVAASEFLGKELAVALVHPTAGRGSGGRLHCNGAASLELLAK